jgi:predicted metal-dependent HD superfamily phosphohydrolase
MQDILKEYWNSTILKYTDELYADELFSNIKQHYTESSRCYHNQTHIQKMLDFSFLYADEIQDADTLQLAIFYHDIIYNSLSKNNEIESAALAVEQLSKTNFPTEKIKLVEQFIVSTQKHFPIIEQLDLPYFLDFDLAILGTERSIYIDYAEKIRKEYKWVPTFLYNKNRKKVLQHFLEREHIYFTEIFRNQYEENARKNLLFEIDELLK